MQMGSLADTPRVPVAGSLADITLLFAAEDVGARLAARLRVGGADGSAELAHIIAW